MTMLRTRNVRGFTLVELLVAMVVLGILSIGITRLLLVQMRFYDRQASAGSARRVSRSSVNRVVADIRMVDTDSGVVSAAPVDITLRVPYAIGVSCNRSTLSLLPVDSTMYSGAAGGYAWRGSTGYYTYVESGVSVGSSGSSSICSDSSVLVLTGDGGRQISISPDLPSAAIAKGSAVFLIHRIRYQLKASALVPGAIGLYRQQMTPVAPEEEIATPFASDARFRFFVGSSATAQDNAPPDLSTIRGIELTLNGQNENAALGETQKRTENFTTAVFFKNRRT